MYMEATDCLHEVKKLWISPASADRLCAHTRMRLRLRWAGVPCNKMYFKNKNKCAYISEYITCLNLCITIFNMLRVKKPIC